MQEAATPPRFLRALSGEALDPPPLWIMRQAGRYLPEYRETRAVAGSFLQLCYSPALAAEVTLQPIRRFGFDASIVFADILIVPDALGQVVSFVEGEGPRLDPLDGAAAIARLDPEKAGAKFASIYETVERVCAGLPRDVPLIGFCGAPWTVATYMTAGHGTSDQAPARLWAYRDPESFQALIDILIAASADYLSGQIEAGARAVQIFDSWAGNLPEGEFHRWVTEPNRRLTAAIKERYPHVPVIGFPRGAAEYYAPYIEQTGVDAVGCDTTLSPRLMAQTLAPLATVQGNLDPLALLAGGRALEEGVAAIKTALAGTPHVFNLGHGILPETPIAHVEKLVALVRGRG